MADNPLLPQHRLSELHALMVRIRKLERRRSNRGAREALLAALRLHMNDGDLLSAPPDDPTLLALAPPTRSASPDNGLPSNLRLPLCAAAARGMQAVAADSIVVAYTEAGEHEPGWIDALAWAHRDRLPLLLVCGDSTEGQAVRGRSRNRAAPLSWTSASKLARKLHLPLFPVDGEDAVAAFRVMQEATARARAQGGPSMIWAVLSSASLSREQQPLRRLERYLAARGISLKT